MVRLAPRHAELSEYLPTSSGEEDRCEDDEDYEEDEDEAVNFDVGKFIENGKHFSHDHRLQVCEHKEEDDEHEDDKCRICGLPILSTPSYNCINGCKFFLHKQCALKFPPKLTHPSHGANFEEKHTLFIIKRSSSPNFIYECEDCNFQIHPLVAAAVIGDDFEIKIRHESHPLHELTTVCKEISCECDACGEKQEGFFFSCQRCNFWIHRDCTILPNVITFLDHPQPFILAFSLPFYQIEGNCLVCREGLIVRHNGVYFCPQSGTFTHVTCGKDKSTMSKTRLNLLQLPDDEWKTSPCLVIRRYAESKPLDPNAYYVPLHVEKEEEDDDDEEDDDEEEEKKDVTLTIEKYHNHPLILNNDYTESCINLVCDLCIQPTTDASTFYTCDLCPFVAHKICADILPILKFFIPTGEDKSFLIAEHYQNLGSYFFNSIFHCLFCHRPCNGPCYYFPSIQGDDDFIYAIDVECMVAPTTINHASHAQHILFRTHRLDRTPLTCCPNESLVYDVYRCILCDYYIHVRCAMLPGKIFSHECHEHPLHLVFTTPSIDAADSDEDGRCFCEVCEKEIDLKYWLYRCDECDQLFHINCIPCVGYLSKVKFGGTLSLPECHRHPLTLTRMLTEHTQRCAHCNQIIPGLEDRIAFFCSICHFWLHFSCARDVQTSLDSPLRLYSDVDDEALMRQLIEEIESEFE